MMESGTAQVVLVLMLMLLIALIARPLARVLRLPFAALLVVIGFVGSEIVVGLGGDTGVRAGLFHDLVFFVFLPVLIFESAVNIDGRLLLQNLGAVLMLAIPILLASTLITAVLVYYGIAHPAGFPWIAALLTGALLSATDPVAVAAAHSKSVGTARVAILLEGESLFNDATAIVLFTILLGLALHPERETSYADGALQFLIVFGAGAAAGLLIGAAAALALRAVGDDITRGLISIIAAYSSFILAERYLHVSGVMAVLMLGLIVGRRMRAEAKDGNFLARLWELSAFAANALLFVLMGVTITVEMFEHRWLAMAIGIAAVLVARAAGIFALMPVAARFTPDGPMNLRMKAALFWGGPRGAVTLALALSLPTELDYWWTIQSIAFGVVVFTLFVQAPTIGLLLKRH
jgi:CPA1 family monovalent cation:H+ antiporter